LRVCRTPEAGVLFICRIAIDHPPPISKDETGSIRN
jgi:hypothetical protein